MDSQIILQSLIWGFISAPPDIPYSSHFYRFEILPLEVIIQLFPLVLLRLVPVSQIYRYYQGKTTRRRALIASIFGDGTYMFYPLFMLIFTYASGLILVTIPIPIPCQFLFCVIVLWRYPIPKPTTPWENISESKSRLDKKPDSITEKLPNENDQLW